MLPSLLTRDIQQGIKQFLLTGFEPSDSFFGGVMQRFVNNESAWLKGPYLQLGLPFRLGESGKTFFTGFTTENPAYIHQEAAWNRLSSNKLAANTLVATGTGSGKTECFLYPLLDHVLRAKKEGEQGIKALVIYPMNALASDQARRFAEVISNTPAFAGMRVGLFVGGQKSNSGDGMIMTKDDVIYDQDTLRKDPPDILLTNYKMLDYLLIRPKDKKLWLHNTPSTLRYLIVDELHTFDGAQGTDLAMLIRRLRARLQIPETQLICAGTSATLGGAEGMAPLCDYASQIFGTDFTVDSVITENRKSVAEFLDDTAIEHFINWHDDLIPKLDHSIYESQAEAVKAWFEVFFPELPSPHDVENAQWRQALGPLLKSHVLFSNLLKKAKGDVIPLAELHTDLKGLSEAARKNIVTILDALLVLVAWARHPEAEKLPLLNMRTQIWMRELRRMVTNVSPVASEVCLFSDKDLPGNRSELFLPLIQCTNCHSSAWLSRMPGTATKVSHNLEEIYNGWFSANPDVVRLYPEKRSSKQLPVEGVDQLLCADCGQLQGNGVECSSCGSERLIGVFRTSAIKSSESGELKLNYHDDTCPDCGSRNRLILLGARSATLGAQVVEQTWSSPFNDDKKLIAFSDSVQDAAHRAGFFTARTYANTTRTAIAKVIDHSADPVIPWSDFLHQLEQSWRDPSSPIYMSREKFVAEFIGPNMQWQNDWANELLKNETLPAKSQLPFRVQKRLAWQAVSEFTYLSQRGRNLDRIGKATLAPDAQRVKNVATLLNPKLQNKLGIHGLSEQVLFHWLWGFVAQLRRRGAVSNPALDQYVEDANIFAFLKGRNEWLPPMSNRTPRPIFVTLGNHRDFDRLVTGFQKTWYENWFDVCIGTNLVLTQKGACEAAYAEAIQCLCNEGILFKCESERFGNSIGINADALNLYRETRMLFTGDNKRRLTVPTEIASDLVGMPCLDAVTLNYASVGEVDSWLSNRFSAGDLRRVIAAEHTGLLEREEREGLETRFKHKSPQPWYENLLSATPTLEMGVDIGSLSSVMLCSVPPNQASFLQRIGRAGRRDGNAMTTTLADGTSPHDLYFFAEPEEMLSGDVTPPGIFLQAPEVLRRQLLAFCMDDWVASGIADSALPDKTSLVLAAIEKLDESRFPYLLKNYMELHEERLLNGFIGLLGDQISAAMINRITHYYKGTEEEKSIVVRLFEVFENLQKEKTQQKNRADEIKKRLTALAQQPKDEAVASEIDQLQRERDSALAIIREIDQRELLNTLADEGLIPNYAFPEAGVELKSILWRKKASYEVSENNYIALPALKYERPAASALSEFAPENRFYANQRRVEIDQINMSLTKPESWRLCPSCQHMENIDLVGDNHEMCPKCGDLMWKNITQKRQLLRFKQAIANSDDTKVRIDDSAEEREPKFYERQLLAEFDIQHVKHAWRLKTDTMPFGFEFISKVQFRDINFGESGGSGDKFKIADKESARPGFKLCKHCGKVQKPARRDNKKDKAQDHAFDCVHRDSDFPENIVDCLFLYREFTSEALRILVPFTRTGVDERVIQSFMAALQLGLKKRFGGKVDHLRMVAQDEPVEDGAPRRHYIMLYDSVPGGTGYLDQLLSENAQTLTDVLKLAYEAIQSCRCNLSPEKDGCYRCLYQYRLGRAMENVSRTCAGELLEDLLAATDKLEKVDNISEIFINPQFDSVLESRFVESLKRLSGKNGLPNAKIERDIIKGKSGYSLAIGSEKYWIELQVNLGKDQGVVYPCKPDCVIWPIKAKTLRRPVAVFCDGWQYHQSLFREDARKRSSLVMSGKFWVWSVTSDDIDAALKGEMSSDLDSPLLKFANNDGTKTPPAIRANEVKFQQNAIALLLDLLVTGADSSSDTQLLFMQRQAAVLTFRMLDINKSLIDQRTEQKQFWQLLPVFMQSFPETAAPIITSAELNPCVRVQWPQSFAKGDFSQADSSAIVMLDENLSAPEELRLAWRYWLSLYNHLQVLPNTLLVSRSGLDAGDYACLSEINLSFTSVNELASAQEQEWNNICDSVMATLLADVRALQSYAVTAPDEVGFSVEVDDSEYIAELVWFEQKIVVLLGEETKNSAIWKNDGWHVVCVDADWTTKIQQLLTDKN